MIKKLKTESNKAEKIWKYLKEQIVYIDHLSYH